MNKLFTGLFGFIMMIGLMVFSSDAAFAEAKLAYLDVPKVLDGYKKTKDNDARLDELRKGKQQEIEGMENEIRQMRDELELLTESSREEKEGEIRDKIQALQDYGRATSRDLQKAHSEVAKEILKDVDDVVTNYGKSEGFDMIFTERAVVYYQDKYDITDAVLARLNKGYKK